MMTKEATKSMYLTTCLTQKQLAIEAGVSEKTLYLWAKQGRWKELKNDTLPITARLVEDLYAQMAEINAAISSGAMAGAMASRSR